MAVHSQSGCHHPLLYDFSVHLPSTQTMASSRSFCVSESDCLPIVQWICSLWVRSQPPSNQLRLVVRSYEATWWPWEVNMWWRSVPRQWTADALWPQVPKLGGVQVARREQPSLLRFWEQNLHLFNSEWYNIRHRHHVCSFTGPQFKVWSPPLSHSQTPHSYLGQRQKGNALCVPEAKNLN